MSLQKMEFPKSVFSDAGKNIKSASERRSFGGKNGGKNVREKKFFNNINMSGHRHLLHPTFHALNPLILWLDKTHLSHYNWPS